MKLYDVFPTKIFVDESADTNVNHQEMMADIDEIIRDKTHVRSPFYQSRPMMFNESMPHFNHNWRELKHSFENLVWTYLSLAREEFGPPEQYKLDRTTAWFYRKDMNNLADTYSNNPMHNHHPALVVGVYYLHNPGYNGTTLYNPNTFKHSTAMTHTVPLGEGAWVLFPGWMQHSTSSAGVADQLERTVIACNAYLV